MSELLLSAIEALRQLPEERQDAIARVIINYSAQEPEDEA